MDEEVAAEKERRRRKEAKDAAESERAGREKAWFAKRAFASADDPTPFDPPPEFSQLMAEAHRTMPSSVWQKGWLYTDLYGAERLLPVLRNVVPRLSRRGLRPIEWIAANNSHSVDLGYSTRHHPATWGFKLLSDGRVTMCFGDLASVRRAIVNLAVWSDWKGDGERF